MSDTFQDRYGPWALVAGASEGIGAEFVRALAARGLNLVMIARRPEPLERLAGEVEQDFQVNTQVLPLDLCEPDWIDHVADATSAIDIGLVIYNATISHLGYFTDLSRADKMQVTHVNVDAPVLAADHFAPQLVARGRGGMIFMGSMAGWQGTSMVATYSGTKAFMRVFAEALWAELAPKGVDVLACVAGATDTPGYRMTNPAAAVPVQNSGAVVREALQALGRRPLIVTGGVNRLAAFVFNRLLPRSWAVRFMRGQMRRQYDP